MRNPALHIRLSDFITVCGNVGVKMNEKLALALFARAVPFSINDRYIINGDIEVRRRAHKVVNNAKSLSMTVERFNRLLVAHRMAIGHKRITPIRKDSRDYQLLKEIAGMACDFCHACGFESIDEGCKVYIQLGVEKMKYGNTYSLGKFKFYDTAIYTEYESLEMIMNDPKPKRTRRFHDCYATLLMEYAAIDRDLSKSEDYVCFVYTRIEADKVKADMEDWLRAQFEELGKVFGSVPNPNQLFSDNALKRYYNYMRTNVKSDNEEEIVWIEPTSDFEKKYEEKLKLKYAKD